MKTNTNEYQLYSAIAEKSQFRIVVFEKNHLDQFTVVDCNENALQNNTVTRNEIIGKTLNQLLGVAINSRSLTYLHNQLNKCLNGKTSVLSEERVFINKITHIKKNQFLPVIQSKKVTQIIMLSYLTNTLENSKDKLVESKAKFQSILNTTFAGVLIHFEGLVLETNESFLTTFGYERNEIIDKNFLDFIVDRKDQKMVKKRILSHFQEPFDAKLKNHLGDSFYGQFESSQFKSKTGETISVTIVRDITLQRMTNIKLIQAKNELSQFQKLAKIGNFSMNLETLEMKQSREHKLLIQPFSNSSILTTQEFISKQILQEDQAKVQKKMINLKKHGHEKGFSDHFEFRAQNEKGKVSHFKVSLFHKNILEAQGFTQDITQTEKQIENLNNIQDKKNQTIQDLEKALEMNSIESLKYDVATKRLTFTKGLLRIFDLPLNKKHLKPIELFRCIEPKDKFYVFNSLRDLMPPSQINTIDFEIITPNKRRKQIRIKLNTSYKRAWVESVFATFQEINNTQNQIERPRPNTDNLIYKIDNAKKGQSKVFS